MIILTALINTVIIDKITFPLKEFIGYAKEFDRINFKEVSNEMSNSDFIKLSNAFNELQQKLFETINETNKKNNDRIVRRLWLGSRSMLAYA